MEFILSVLGLFDDTLSAIMAVPVLAFFVCFLLFAVIWLVSSLHVIGCIGGLVFLVLALLGWVQVARVETRCGHCRERFDCPAADSGPCYPCPYYEKEVNTHD